MLRLMGKQQYILLAKKYERGIDTMKKVELLFDAVRAPYDIAIIVQVALAINCQIYTCGNCIPFDNKKIKNKVTSWNIKDYPNVIHYDTFENAVSDLKSKGKLVVGTSGNTDKIYYDMDFTDKDVVIVFGSESSGLSLRKQKMLDDLVKLPMSSKLDFLTLPVVVSAIAYDLNRQYNFK